MWPRPLLASQGSAAGQQEFTTVGADTFTVPPGVTRVSVVCIGGGEGGNESNSNPSGGDGGGISWKNDIPVTPGEEISLYVGAGGSPAPTSGPREGEDTWFKSVSDVIAPGGGSSTTRIGDGGNDGTNGGNGFSSSSPSYRFGGGGGGSGPGYSGAGANGGGAGNNGSNGSNGSGGGGGGGQIGTVGGWRGGRGGGTGLTGEGSNGTGGTGGSGDGDPGTPGSGGSGGLYGAGGGGYPELFGSADNGQKGGVRVIWGWNRSYPSTNTGDV